MIVTDKQKQDLIFIKLFTERRGYAPTVAEIAGEAGNKSVNAARVRINALIEKGVLSHSPRKPRTLRVTELGEMCLK